MQLFYQLQTRRFYIYSHHGRRSAVNCYWFGAIRLANASYIRLISQFDKSWSTSNVDVFTFCCIQSSLTVAANMFECFFNREIKHL